MGLTGMSLAALRFSLVILGRRIAGKFTQPA
jgi:hypothetical protein